MTGKVESVIEEHEIAPRGGFLRGASAAETEFVASLVYTHTDGKKLTAQGVDSRIEVAQAYAIVALKDAYNEAYPKPKTKIVQTIEIDFDA